MKTAGGFIMGNMLILLASTVFGQGLKDSHHDFTGASWSNGEACIPCHTPHHANMEVPDSPLWNHENTTAIFEIYSSPTLEASPGQPTGHSKLCFSCHDGTVAVENHSGITNGTRYTTFGNLTTGLRDDHPISFEYSTSLATIDGFLYDPVTAPSGLGGTIQEDLLENGYLQCTSCHDVHLSRNTEGCTGCHQLHTGEGMVTVSLSLWKSNIGSALCLTCHRK